MSAYGHEGGRPGGGPPPDWDRPPAGRPRVGRPGGSPPPRQRPAQAQPGWRQPSRSGPAGLSRHPAGRSPYGGRGGHLPPQDRRRSIYNAPTWAIVTITVVATVAFVALLLLTQRYLAGQEAAQSGASATPPAEAFYWDLDVGTCFNDPNFGRPGSRVLTVTVVPCDQPHDAELFAAISLQGDAYPGRAKLEQQVQQACPGPFQQYVGAPYGQSRYEIFYYYPLEDSWQRFRDRRVLDCAAIDPDRQKLTGSVRGTRR